MKTLEKIKKKIGGIKKETAVKAEVIPPKCRKAEQYRENLYKNKKPSKKEAKTAWDFAVESAFKEGHGY